MSECVLVTGAAGFAGRHLLDLLLEDPAPVVAWDRPGRPLPAGRNGRVRWMPVDLLNRDGVFRAVHETRPGVIYHCAGAAHVGQSWERSRETLAANVLATHHVIEAARQARLDCRILIPSSATIYRPSASAISEQDPLGPDSPYALSKVAQEMLGIDTTRSGGPRAFVARSFNHLGPGQAPTFAASSFARQIALIEAGRSEPVIKVGNLDARRDVTDVRDTVRAYRTIVDRGEPGIPYNVCSGRLHAIHELLQGLLDQAHVRVRLEPDPALMRPLDNPVLLGNGARVRQLGWAPRISLDETLADLLGYWREQVRTQER